VSPRPLPQPERERWQPLRTGLVDIFYYDHEEFWFRDGRLLLRGNNGTGKSKVLALTLPFLLDGELSPHRVEPDADPKKRMDWNLLLGGEHPNDERLGYAWLEFGRRDLDGSAHFCTLGCGLKAVSGRGISSHWFFLTDQRVGAELALVDGAGIALTRERLEEAIGPRGAVYRTARAHRRAVDEALFGLGEQRYGALLDLLIKIRAPQLSKRPNERALSEALTGALPPLDQALIADAAEAFRGLEEDRNALAAMIEARDAAEKYLTTYRHYAQIACRRRAALPRQAQTAFDRVSRELADAQTAHTNARSELAAAEAALAELRTEEERLRARERTLRESPEARSARELERAAEEACGAAERAAQAQQDHDRSGERLEQQRARAVEADARRAQADERLAQARAAAASAAQAASIAEDFAERVDRAIEMTAATDDSSAAEIDTDATESATGSARADSTEPRQRASVDAIEPHRRASMDATELRRRAEEIADRQQRALGNLAALLQKAADARRAVADVRERHAELEGEAAVLGEQRVQATQRLGEVGHDLMEATRRYLRDASALNLADAPEVLAALELWVETLDGLSPLAGALAVAGRVASAALARSETELEIQASEVRQFASGLDASIERLQAGEHETPPTPHTRDDDAREGRSGAPLWQLVDFHPSVPEAQRAGIEAALEASGILDAWVSPDGELLSPGTHDVLLTPDTGDRTTGAGGVTAVDGASGADGVDGTAAVEGVSGVGGARLSDVLEPAIDREHPQARAVRIEAVQRVLATVALAQGDGAVWVTPEGEFRNGVLRGAWRKQLATFIGRGAREAARRERLAELREQREQADTRLRELAGAQARLLERRAELEAELQRTPSEEPLREAHGALVALDTQQARLAERIAAMAARLEQAETERLQAEQVAQQTAEDLRLPDDPARLGLIGDGLQAFRLALAALWPALHARDDAHEAAALLAADVDVAAREFAGHGERLATVTREAAASAERHQTLQQTVGAAVAELQRRLAEVAADLRENERERVRTDVRRAQAQREEGIQTGLCQKSTADLEHATERRRDDIEALRRFAGTGLIAVALDEIELPETEEEWGVTAALRLARQIEQTLGDVADDDPTWQRAQRRASDEHGVLADALRRHGNNSAMHVQDESITIEVVFRGRATTVPALAAALAEEVADRSRLLDEREREILENHLVNEVASTLQELISQAERYVVNTNAELAQRPTSTGMQLRLHWRVLEEGPPGLAEARERLLRQSADAWSEEDRAAVGAFLQAQIQEVRSREVAGTWIEHLTEALDYRAWHRFAIERQQGGRWRSATGPASGGERVLSASVPLFAAASSYYASAGNARAPRLVMLDEAFAGVDDDARAKCLGLLAAFDLDVVMTSEREWGCYSEVPGLAIAQLARVEGIAAVLVTHWEWDGASRTRTERPLAVVASTPVESVDGAPANAESVDAVPLGGESAWETPSANG